MLDVMAAGLILVLAGFGVIALSLLSSAKNPGTEASGGGVVMIGPIPIIFGSDAKWATVAILLAIVLVMLYIVFLV